MLICPLPYTHEPPPPPTPPPPKKKKRKKKKLKEHSVQRVKYSVGLVKIRSRVRYLGAGFNFRTVD